MGAIEQHLDKQINALRNDLKISGQEAKLAKLRAEQAVISKKIASVGKHSAKKEKKSRAPVTKPSKHGQTLATPRQGQGRRGAASRGPARRRGSG